MPAEAACLYDDKLKQLSPVEIEKNIFLCLSGMGYESAKKAAIQFLDLNINALISWGVAGALDPLMNSGDLIIANQILTNDKTYRTTYEWNKKLSVIFTDTKHNVINANIISASNICATIEDKKKLFLSSGAVAVDMESSAIAETAFANKLDFIVIRSIADKADTTIPEAVLNHTDNLGNPEILKFVSSCISRPKQINEIMLLAKSYKKALKTLQNIAEESKKQHFFYA